MACYDISYLDKTLKNCKYCNVMVVWETNKKGKGYFCNVFPSASINKHHAGIYVVYTHSLHKCDEIQRREYRELLGANHPDNKPREEKKLMATKPVPVTDDRMTVTGTVEFLKMEDNGYGEQLKARIVCDGYKLWGSVPKSITDTVAVGTRVKFDAKVTPSAKDESFGFFSRPTKASTITEG